MCLSLWSGSSLQPSVAHLSHSAVAFRCYWEKNETVIQGPAPSREHSSTLINHNITLYCILRLLEALVLTPYDDWDRKVGAGEKGHLLSPARSLLNPGTQQGSCLFCGLCLSTKHFTAFVGGPMPQDTGLQSTCYIAKPFPSSFVLLIPCHNFLNSVYPVYCVLAFFSRMFYPHQFLGKYFSLSYPFPSCVWKEHKMCCSWCANRNRIVVDAQ